MKEKERWCVWNEWDETLTRIETSVDKLRLSTHSVISLADTVADEKTELFITTLTARRFYTKISALVKIEKEQITPVYLWPEFEDEILDRLCSLLPKLQTTPWGMKNNLSSNCNSLGIKQREYDKYLQPVLDCVENLNYVKMIEILKGYLSGVIFSLSEYANIGDEEITVAFKACMERKEEAYKKEKEIARAEYIADTYGHPMEELPLAESIGILRQKQREHLEQAFSDAKYGAGYKASYYRKEPLAAFLKSIYHKKGNAGILEHIVMCSLYEEEIGSMASTVEETAEGKGKTVEEVCKAVEEDASQDECQEVDELTSKLVKAYSKAQNLAQREGFLFVAAVCASGMLKKLEERYGEKVKDVSSILRLLQKAIPQYNPTDKEFKLQERKMKEFRNSKMVEYHELEGKTMLETFVKNHYDINQISHKEKNAKTAKDYFDIMS